MKANGEGEGSARMVQLLALAHQRAALVEGPGLTDASASLQARTRTFLARVAAFRTAFEL